MRTTKAFIASFGTSLLLVGSSVTMLAVVSAVLAFRGIPGPRVDTPAQTVVVRATDEPADEIQLTQDEIDDATAEPDQDEPAAQPDDGGAASPSSSSSPSEDPATIASNSNGDSGSPDPVADDPGDGGNGDNRNNLQRGIDELPGRVRETVDGVDLGRNGRDATRLLSDGVVSKLSPKLAEDVKKTTEPVWELLDRDP
jgi:hypothetical protein